MSDAPENLPAPGATPSPPAPGPSSSEPAPAAAPSALASAPAASPAPATIAPTTGTDPDEPRLPPSRAEKWAQELRARGRYPELAAFLAFLVPGLGHVYLGRHRKGLLAFVVLVGLFGWGVGISRGECVSLAADEDSGHRYAFVAQVGAGLPTALALLSTHSYQVKTALGMKAQEPDRVSNHFQDDDYVERLPKLDEGLLYTMIAGLLNLLLIYDAFLGSPGAALRPRPEDALLEEVAPEPEGAAGPPPGPPPEPPPGSSPAKEAF